MGNNGKVLAFDEKFQERPIKAQLEYMHKLCASQNDALDIMQKERNEWLEKAKELEFKVKNAENNFYAQKAIAETMITKANSDNQVNGERIRDLERKVGELGGDIN